MTNVKNLKELIDFKLSLAMSRNVNDFIFYSSCSDCRNSLKAVSRKYDFAQILQYVKLLSKFDMDSDSKKDLKFLQKIILNFLTH